MKNTFFCYGCRKHKAIALLVTRPGKKDLCAPCVAIADNNSKQSKQDKNLQEAKRKSKNYTNGSFIVRD